MNKELIMESDVLDIIFEKRNKAYGAYNLRKFYNNRLMKSLGFMCGAVVILSAFTFIDEQKTADPTIYDTRIVAILHEPVKKKEIEKSKVTRVSKPAQATPVLSKLVIVEDIHVIQPITAANDSGLMAMKVIPGATGDGPGTIPVKVGGTEPVVTQPEPTKAALDKTLAIANPDVMPEFPGGMDALHSFLQRNLTNPREIEEGNMVSVEIQFVVGYDGRLQRFHIVEDGGEVFNNEVIRVLKKMPEWKPGKAKGENVSVYYTIPVKFVPAE